MPRGTALTGAGRYADGTLALTLDTRGLDLKAWDTRMVATRLSGSVNLQANAQQQSVTALLTERDYRIETDLYRTAEQQGEEFTGATRLEILRIAG